MIPETVELQLPAESLRQLCALAREQQISASSVLMSAIEAAYLKSGGRPEPSSGGRSLTLHLTAAEPKPQSRAAHTQSVKPAKHTKSSALP